MSPARLLIVHPERAARSLLTSMLFASGHSVQEAENDRAAVRQMERSEPDLLLAAVDPADPDCLELLAYARRKHPRMSVVLLQPAAGESRAEEALRSGASAVLRYPMPAAELRSAVAQALEPVAGRPGPSLSPQPAPSPAPAPSPKRAPADAYAGAAPAGPAPAAEGADVVGEDPALLHVLELAAALAPTRTPVLLAGERGTGKTLLARRLHARSLRADGPLVEVACGLLKESVLERELFGARAAGPADAPGDRPGKLAQAHGGTLLLDEVAALTPDLQLKLLRVLQAGEYEPVGSAQTLRADVRILATTREDLAARVEQGAFRPDLYYRLGVVSLQLPPLRRRGADIERLAEHFRARFARELGRDAAGFAPDALAALREHDWPGNVHELESAVERGVLLCRGPLIQAAQLGLGADASALRSPRLAPPSRAHASPGLLPLKEALEGPEKQIILRALEALNWNRQETARALDINRTTLYKKMKKYGLLVIGAPAWVN